MESAQPCSQDQVQNTHREYDLNMDDGGRIGSLQAIPIHWCHGFFAIGLVLEMSTFSGFFYQIETIPKPVLRTHSSLNTNKIEDVNNPRTVTAVLSHGENNPIVVA